MRATAVLLGISFMRLPSAELVESYVLFDTANGIEPHSTSSGLTTDFGLSGWVLLVLSSLLPLPGRRSTLFEGPVTV